MTFKVDLRKKTTQKLDATTCQTLREVISQILCLRDYEMEQLIWSLTHESAVAAKRLGFENLTASETIVIRAELCTAYRKFHSTWDYGHRYTPSTDAESALLKALHGDQYAYDTVMTRIVQRSQRTNVEVTQILRRLNSQKETSQFGGVRSLGFRYEEANFLKGAANQMGQVLEPLAKAS